MAKIEYPVVETRPAKNSKSGAWLEGKCPECGKWVTLTHKTKTRPQGAQFHRHVGLRPNRYGTGKQTCFGSPYYRTDTSSSY